MSGKIFLAFFIFNEPFAAKNLRFSLEGDFYDEN